MLIRLRLRQFVAPGQVVHVARSTFPRTTALALHAHDFAEVFWVERGKGVHLINGTRQPLQRGCLVLMRPQDRHSFAGTSHQPMTILNVAFDAGTLAHLQKRYFPQAATWPWQGGDLPTMLGLPTVRLDELTARAEQLSSHARQLELDGFLMALLQWLAPPQAGAPDPQAPWLRQALESLRQQEDLSEGPAGLARLAGRSVEHVNRVLRRQTGRTATQCINDLRLQRAAELLRMTNRGIVDVAADSGFANLGYFYRLFAARHGMTPRRYRLAAHAVTAHASP